MLGPNLVGLRVGVFDQQNRSSRQLLSSFHERDVTDEHFLRTADEAGLGWTVCIVVLIALLAVPSRRINFAFTRS